MKVLENIEELERIVEEEGNEKDFVYRGYECLIRRHSFSKHLCGYIRGQFIGKEKEIIDDNFHKGITYDNNNNLIGFDCGHICDINMNSFSKDGVQTFWFGETYKTMSYVEEVLKSTIDELREWES